VLHTCETDGGKYEIVLRLRTNVEGALAYLLHSPVWQRCTTLHYHVLCCCSRWLASVIN